MASKTKFQKALRRDKFICNLSISNLPVALGLVVGDIICTRKYYTSVMEPILYILIMLAVGIYAINACGKRKNVDKSERFLKRYLSSLTDPCIICIYTSMAISAAISRFLWETMLAPIGFLLVIPITALIMTWVKKNAKGV